MKIIERILRFFLILAMTVIFVVVTAEVFSRFIFHISIPWGAEVSQTLLVWLTFIGSAAVFLRNEHINVDFLAERLQRRARIALGRLNLLIIMAFLACGVWSGIRVVTRTWRGTTAALQIPAGVLYLALPISFALMFLFALWMLFAGKEKVENPPS